MTQYLLGMFQPDGPPPADLDLTSIMRELGRVQDEMKAAGAWVFTAQLQFADTATTVSMKDGEQLVTDGPYPEGKEHLGGFTIVEAPDLDAALGWARRITAITYLPIEVRPVR